MPNLYPFSAGVDSVGGYGQAETVCFQAAWAVGETWTLAITSTEQGDITLGRGRFAGANFVCGLTFNDRVYLGNKSKFQFCDTFDPTGWEEQNPGAGIVNFQTSYGVQDQVNAMASFQGRLAMFGQYNIQIWNADADPANFSRVQRLENLGTKYSLSVQSLGDFDVLFLDSTGFRSLRVRDSSLNAIAIDLGTPIDSIIQEDLLTTPTNVCAIVEPESKRYWCAIDDTIYVLSYYPSSKIAAWSTYKPGFTPVKFVVFQGQVWVRDDRDNLYLFGGDDNNTYDNCVAVAETPWLDDKTPATEKISQGVNCACEGAWILECGLDLASGVLTEVAALGDAITPDETKDSSFDSGRLAFEATGTHFKLKATSAAESNQKAVLSSLIFHYNKGNSP